MENGMMQEYLQRLKLQVVAINDFLDRWNNPGRGKDCEWLMYGIGVGKLRQLEKEIQFLKNEMSGKHKPNEKGNEEKT